MLRGCPRLYVSCETCEHAIYREFGRCGTIFDWCNITSVNKCLGVGVDAIHMQKYRRRNYINEKRTIP